MNWFRVATVLALGPSIASRLDHAIRLGAPAEGVEIPNDRTAQAGAVGAAPARRSRSDLQAAAGLRVPGELLRFTPPYYLVRNNLALASPEVLREHPGYTKAQLGSALTALSIAYGVSKFLMGSVSDRSNLRHFLPWACSSLMCDHVRLRAGQRRLRLAVSTDRAPGSEQLGPGDGLAPCGRAMVHGFSTRERGLTVSIWNSLTTWGGALVAQLALVGVVLFHDWGAKLNLNAVIAALVAVMVFFLLRDTPQSCGLPPIE